jgi:hypothetical protein
MTTKTLIVTILISSLTALGGDPAAAGTSADSAAQATTRAQVLADLVIYRESGLAQANLPENFGTDASAKTKAQTKYAELRASAHYAALVKRYGGSPDAATVAASR